jgi:hypothetical protein
MSTKTIQVAIPTDSEAVVLLKGTSQYGKAVPFDQTGQPPQVSLVDGDGQIILSDGLVQDENGELNSNQVVLRGSLTPGVTSTVKFTADGIQGDEHSAEPIEVVFQLFSVAPVAADSNVSNPTFRQRQA